MFEGVQEGIRTQFFCGEVKFNIIATSRNVLRLWKHFWRPLEAAWGHNGHRMQKWYNFHPKDTYYSWALPSNIILRLILRLIEVIWGCLRSFKVILLCKILVEGISDIKLSLCIRWLDFLCLGFNEHVFEAKVEAEKRRQEVAEGCLCQFCCSDPIWQSENLQISTYIYKIMDFHHFLAM